MSVDGRETGTPCVEAINLGIHSAARGRGAGAPTRTAQPTPARLD